MVGVEGVPHPEGVRREPEPDAEDLGAADVEVARRDDPISTPQPTTCRAATKNVIPPIEPHSPGVREALTRAILLWGAASVETAMLTFSRSTPAFDDASHASPRQR